ncbi:MAG: hypothetical protein JST43_04545 [Bacteroidetes bacterium]|nr:hypothetical protein [Bacteroidota bacterium]MBS1539908.1 hypothetical protein [Bacteroidota bacterium]
MTTSKKSLLFLFLGLYVVSMIWLSTAWYGSFTAFHFFDDLLEWQYLDKLGHFFASFHLGLYFYQVLGNSHHLNPIQRKKWISFSGFLLLLPIEILDGFSQNYGASPADLLANGLGSLYCYSHISYRAVASTLPKFSFHTTAFHWLRPDLLGNTFAQQALKDYNGQTYWVSVSVNKIFSTTFFPDWLALSIGYGAEGMLGGHDNVWQDVTGKTFDYTSVARTKRFILSADVVAAELMKKNKVFSYLFRPFVLLKFPAPAIEWNDRGFFFHPIYF